jgi:large subunit ribosomal protein L6
MSRVAKQVVPIPAGVTVTIAGGVVSVKGAKGALQLAVSAGVSVSSANQQLAVSYQDQGAARTRAGSVRAHLANMVAGVTRGYERKLELVGVGFRAAVAGKSLNLTLGFSHPVAYAIPEGISIETPSQTEIVIKGADRQRVGQTAAEIRDIRPPEPYKGKGVRYEGEVVRKKLGKAGKAGKK